MVQIIMHHDFLKSQFHNDEKYCAFDEDSNERNETIEKM